MASREATEAPNTGTGAQQLVVVVAAAAERGEQRVSRERPLAIRSFRGSRKAELDPGGRRETLEFGNREMRSGRTEGRGGGGGGREARAKRGEGSIARRRWRRGRERHFGENNLTRRASSRCDMGSWTEVGVSVQVRVYTVASLVTGGHAAWARTAVRVV